MTRCSSPAIGWPSFIGLGIVYFAMAYLLLGSVFLTIGSMATTVREVQTLSMPVSMSQLMVFFFATYATAVPGSTLALVAKERAVYGVIAVTHRGPFVIQIRMAGAKLVGPASETAPPARRRV